MRSSCRTRPRPRGRDRVDPLRVGGRAQRTRRFAPVSPRPRRWDQARRLRDRDVHADIESRLCRTTSLVWSRDPDANWRRHAARSVRAGSIRTCSREGGALLRHAAIHHRPDTRGRRLDRAQRGRADRHWDPYPFILLNLAFSTQAAYAAPLILLAQTRQADRDKAAASWSRRTARRWPATQPSTRPRWSGRRAS